MNLDSIQKYVDEEKDRMMGCECCNGPKTTYLYIAEKGAWIMSHICEECYNMLKDQPSEWDYVMIKKFIQ